MICLVISIMSLIFAFVAWKQLEIRAAFHLLAFAMIMGLIAYAQLA